MKIQVIQTLPNGQVTQQVLSKDGAEVLKIQAQPGAKVSFNVEGGKPVESMATKPKTGDIKKVGNNLVLESEGEQLVEVNDFYSTAGASVGDVGWSYASADAGAMTATHEAQALSSEAAASESGAFLPVIAPGWLVAGGVGAVAVVASGGSSAVASVANTVITGSVMLGPVKAGSNLLVTLYKADGSVLTTATVQNDGTFTASYEATYTGVVMARLTDNNGNSTADYRDEATNSDKDLTADIRALFSTTGAGNVNITLSALSEMAVRQILGDSGGDAGASGSVAGTKTAAEITAKNAALAASLGLTGNVVTDFVIHPTVNADGSAATPNTAGLIVAALSGLDAIYGTDGTLDLLTATGTTTASVVEWVAVGAQQAGVLTQLSAAVSSVGAAVTAAGVSALALDAAAQTSATLAALSPLVIAQLSTAQIAALPDAAMAGLTAAQLAALLPAQIGYITATQINFLSAAQIFALGADIGSLSPTAVASLDTTQVQALTSVQLNALVSISAPTTSAALSNDKTPTITGTFTGNLPLGAIIHLFDGATDLGTASVTGATWAFTPSTDLAADGAHSFTARVMISGGSNATASAAYAYTLDSIAPTFAPVTMTAAENSTAITGTLGATDTTGVTYSLGSGLDTALFSLSGSTLSLLAAKNYEVDETTDHAYTLNVIATDAVGNATTSVVTVNLTNVNEAPTAVGTLGAQTAVVTIPFTFSTASGFSDIDAGGLTGGTYSATGLGNGLAIDPTTGVISGTALASAAAAPVVVTFTDAGGLAVSQAPFNLQAVTAPVVQSFTVADVTGDTTKGKSSEALTFVVTMSQPVTSTAALTAVFTVNGVDVTATSAAVTNAGTITFTGAAVPSGNGTAISLKTLTSTGTIKDSNNQDMVAPTLGGITYGGYTVDNTLPTFAPVTMTAAENGTAITGTLGATDTTGVTYSLGSGLDTALFSLSGSTLSLLAAKNYEVDETTDHAYTLNVIATDAVGNATTSVVTVNLTNVNEAPTPVGTIATQHAISGTAFSLSTAASFADVDAGTTLTYSATGLASGLSINSTTGVITGTHTGAQAAGAVVVTATDGGALSVTQTFQMDVVVAPTITNAVVLDGQSSVDVTSNFVFKLDQAVDAFGTAATKYIRIKNDANTVGVKDGYKGEQTAEDILIDVRDTTQVTVSSDGLTVTVNPTAHLDLSNNYHIEVDAGAFVSRATSLGSAGITDSTTVNFSTVTPADSTTAISSITTASLSKNMSADGLTMTDGKYWVDIEDRSNPNSAAQQVDAGTGGTNKDFVFVFKDYDRAPADAPNTNPGITTDDFFIRLFNFGYGDLLYVDSKTADTNLVNLTVFTGSSTDSLSGAGTRWKGIVTAGTTVATGTEVTTGGALGGKIQISLLPSTGETDGTPASDHTLAVTYATLRSELSSDVNYYNFIIG